MADERMELSCPGLAPTTGVAAVGAASCTQWAGSSYCSCSQSRKLGLCVFKGGVLVFKGPVIRETFPPSSCCSRRLEGQVSACCLPAVAVRRLQSKGILVQVFPLHEQEELKRLSFSWYQRAKLSLQPLGTGPGSQPQAALLLTSAPHSPRCRPALLWRGSGPLLWLPGVLHLRPGAHGPHRSALLPVRLGGLRQIRHLRWV